ncbi:MAG: hypothetical protein JXR86_21405 [Spirochaetales bacterium]|nr:hypothetical protein [Spirochaetales bacterium]
MMEDETSVRIIDFKSGLLVSDLEELKVHYAKQGEYYRKVIVSIKRKEIVLQVRSGQNKEKRRGMLD